MNIHNLVPIIENGVVRWKAFENNGSDGSPWGMDEWKSTMLLHQEDAFCHARVMAMLAREPSDPLLEVQLAKKYERDVQRGRASCNAPSMQSVPKGKTRGTPDPALMPKENLPKEGDFYTVRDGDSMSSIAGSLYNGSERIHRDVPHRRLTSQEHLELGRRVHQHLEDNLKGVSLANGIYTCGDCGGQWVNPPDGVMGHNCPVARDLVRQALLESSESRTGDGHRTGRFGLPTTWTSADGRETLLIDLKMSHLINIIRMINRGQDAKGQDVVIGLDMCRALNNEAERRGLMSRIDLDLAQQHREQVRPTVEAAQLTLAERVAAAEKWLMTARTIVQRRTALAELRLVRRQMAKTTNFDSRFGEYAGAVPNLPRRGGI